MCCGSSGVIIACSADQLYSATPGFGGENHHVRLRTFNPASCSYSRTPKHVSISADSAGSIKCEKFSPS